MDANWKRENLIALIADEAEIEADQVAKRLSQGFRYAQRQLVEAYVEKGLVDHSGDLIVATTQAVATLRGKLQIKTFDCEVEAIEGNASKVKCVGTTDWDLPATQTTKGKEGLNWIGEFDDLF